MKIKTLRCLLALGFLLFIPLLLSFSPFNVTTVKAASIEKETINYRLNLKSITLVKGKSFQLKVINLGENAKVTYKSNDSEIASVSEDGIISANKVGTTIITATVKDGSNITNLTCDITVGPPAISVKWTKSRIILGLDNSDYLRVILKPSNTAEVAKFSSRDSSIVSVSTGGRITGKKLGMTYVFAEIDATNLDGSRKYAVCSVIITNPEDTSYLETYFAEHPELDLISEADLTKALDEFFNDKADLTAANELKLESVSKSSLVNSLNQYLEYTFKLADKRAAIQAAQAKLSGNQVEVISDSSAK